jgi:hypothetical protein
MALFSNVLSSIGAGKRGSKAIGEMNFQDVDMGMFGRMTRGHFDPRMSQTQQNILGRADNNILESMQALRPTQTAQETWANRVQPLADSMYNTASNAIGRQYDSSDKEMQNRLNAQGQLGGSYGAMMQNRLMRDRDDRLAQARGTADAQGYDAYRQWYNDQLQAQQVMENSRAKIRQEALEPWRLAMLQSQLSNSLSAQRANMQLNRSNGWDNASAFVNDAYDLGKSIVSAKAGGTGLGGFFR